VRFAALRARVSLSFPPVLFAGCFWLVIGAAISGADVGASTLAFTVPLGLATSVLAVRAFRVALILDEDGVVVRNAGRTTTLVWSEIVAVGWIPVVYASSQYGTTRMPGVAFRRRDGGVVGAQGTAALPAPCRAALVDALHEAGRTHGIAVTLATEDLAPAWFRKRQRVNPPLTE
jgi:hypothetical protein